MSRYIVTVSNSDTEDRVHGEEIDLPGAQHMLGSWLETKPIGSKGKILEEYSASGTSVTFEGKAMLEWPRLRQVSEAKRVMGGIEWSP